MELITYSEATDIINAVTESRHRQTFSLNYVKKDGSIGFKHKLCKGGHLGIATREVANPDQGGQSMNYKKTGTIPFVNLETNQDFSLVASQITHINSKRIIHG